MINHLMDKLRRSLVFVCFNLFGALFILLFAVVPFATNFVDRTEQIAENKEQLVRLRSLQPSTFGNAQVAASSMLLPGNDEGAVSASLQSDLKSIATDAGAHFLAVRGLESSRLDDSRIVAASLEIEGSVYSLRDVVRKIESQTPPLFIKSATFRGTSADQDSVLRAELTVQALMRNGPPGVADTIGSRDGEGGRGR